MKYPLPRWLAAVALAAAGAASAQVTPPPLPPGASQIRPQAGLTEDERKRYVRAHHHKQHHKKDFTKDDSVPETEAPGKSGDAKGKSEPKKK